MVVSPSSTFITTILYHVGMQEQLVHFQLESKELLEKNQQLEERVDVLLKELKEMKSANSTLKSKNTDLEEELEAVVQAAGGMKQMQSPSKG